MGLAVDSCSLSEGEILQGNDNKGHANIINAFSRRLREISGEEESGEV